MLCKRTVITGPTPTVKYRDLHELRQFALQITVESYRRLLRTLYKSLMICVNCVVILLCMKCDMQRLLTSQIYSFFNCGDVELNPGPTIPLWVLTSRLAEIGRQPVNIQGDGDCFFRSICHQLYATEAYHAQIRERAVQHLVNYPEYFIESNIEQSWFQYLQNMSRLGPII